MVHLGEGSLFEQWDAEHLEKEVLFPYLVVLAFDDGREFTLREVFTPVSAARASEAKAQALAMVKRVADRGSVDLEKFWVESTRAPLEQQWDAEWESEDQERRGLRG